MKVKNQKILLISMPILVICFMFLGYIIAPNDPFKVNLALRFSNTSDHYPFGNDDLGRCIFSRILYGGRTTIYMVLLASILIFILGILIGAITSKVMMKKNIFVEALINAVTAIPPIAYLIIFVASWGSGVKTTLIALVISYILRFVRLARTQINLESEKAYVMCMTSLGASKFRILLIHILPNIISELIHYLCLSCADMILAITAFSFIGLGLGDNVVEWGNMILEARKSIFIKPNLILYPMIAVLLTTVSFNLLGRQVIRK
ncbi:MAG: ABC transporter permease [Eubacteriales bacterium]|nr:ABC transporter permease [Eubacteriales bacterium]